VPRTRTLMRCSPRALLVVMTLSRFSFFSASGLRSPAWRSIHCWRTTLCSSAWSWPPSCNRCLRNTHGHVALSILSENDKGQRSKVVELKLKIVSGFDYERNVRPRVPPAPLSVTAVVKVLISLHFLSTFCSPPPLWLAPSWGFATYKK